MAWAKIDDGWWSHPKVMDLSLAASGLWARAISWSCHQRRDTVPARFLAMVGADEHHAQELVDAGLWRVCDRGWVIHDWAVYQEQSISEKRAEAGAKGGKRSGEVRREASDQQPAKQTRSKTKQTDEANRQAGALPVPSPPNPTVEPKPLAPAPPPRTAPATPRPADPIFDALVQVCRLNPGELTKSARGRVNRAAKELRDIGATAGGIQARAAVHRQRWPDAELTPTSLSTNYAQLGTAAGKPTAVSRPDREVGTPEYEARMAAEREQREALAGVR